MATKIKRPATTKAGLPLDTAYQKRLAEEAEAHDGQRKVSDVVREAIRRYLQAS